MTRIRELVGLSKVDLAKKLGVSVFTVRSWELPVSSPRHRPINQLAADRMLQMEIDLFKGDYT